VQGAATAQKGLYPKFEAMPSNYRQLADATADNAKRQPTAEEIGDTVSFESLTDQGKGHLAAIMAYENQDVLIRFAEDQELDLETAERVFYGLKQYLVVCVFTGGKRSPAKIIDECWHTFLLHSKDYAKFCDQYLRGFVHHDPAIDDSGFSFYPLTRRCAMEIFGELDEEIWPANHRHYVRCVSTKDAEPARFTDFRI
jgi:hypothetical protein